jgi:2-(1,2-epoxy-1,2-dihydrophenyl)acetyl-CoA isomerase
MLSAQEAAAAGLINRVVDASALDQEARTLASRLAEGPTLAFGELKNLLMASSAENIEAQLENEARSVSRLARTQDSWDAILAVLNKQRPVFSGR